MPRQPNYDPEQAFLLACRILRWEVTRPEREGGRVDFFLPKFGLYVEVKAYGCERLIDQINSVNNGAGPMMVLIGMKGVLAFISMLHACHIQGETQDYLSLCGMDTKIK